MTEQTPKTRTIEVPPGSRVRYRRPDGNWTSWRERPYLTAMEIQGPHDRRHPEGERRQTNRRAYNWGGQDRSFCEQDAPQAGRRRAGSDRRNNERKTQ